MTDQEMEKRSLNLKNLQQVLRTLIVPLVNVAASWQEHEEKIVGSAAGAHGLRYYGDGLEAYNGQTEEWDEVMSQATPITIPTVSGSSTFTYNGALKTLSFTGFDSNTMIKTGDTGTNAGSYIAEVSLKNTGLYKWSDGTTAPRIFNWTINKGTGTATLSKNSVSLSGSLPSDTVTVSGATGEVTVSSSDPTIATASYSNGAITITSPLEESGDATITVNIAESANHSAASKTISVSVVAITIYGAEWDGSSTPLWTRTDASASFTDPSPAVNNGNGSSPFDNCMPWSGMRRVEDSVAGTLVEIPKFWYKWTFDGSKMKLQIADGPVEGFLVSPAHMDRGDGKGERDFVYIGAYPCATSSYKSQTNTTPVNNITITTARNNIKNLGSGIFQFDYAMLWTIRMLYLVEYANWNSQNTIGIGTTASSSSDVLEKTGKCDRMTYHTGTNVSSRDQEGIVRYRWIEGLWSNLWVWCDGIYQDLSYVYCIKNPSDFSQSGGVKVNSRLKVTNNAVIASWKAPLSEAVGYEYALLPKSYSTSSNATQTRFSTYVCDRYYDNSDAYNVFYAGGGYNTTSYYYFGLFSTNTNRDIAYEDGIGCRLMKLP